VDGTVYAFDSGKLIAINPDGTQQWTVDEYVETTPAIAVDGTVYCGASRNRFRALNSDGSGKWLFQRSPGGGGNYDCSAPTIGPDGTIYVGSVGLFAINPDGTQRWHVSTGDPVVTNAWVLSSPAVAPDGTVYAGCLDANVYAVQPDGDLRWTFPTSGAVWAGTGATIAPDGTVYIASDFAMYAINPDGTEKWSFTTGAVYGGARSCPAIAPDGTVYFGAMTGTLYAFYPSGVIKWDFPAGTGLGGRATSPVLGADGTVYVGADYNVVAVSAGGAERWRYAFSTWVDGSASIAEDGTLYVLCQDGKLYAFGP
jgi:outer membrane protein assembly factor BamB